MVKGGWTIKKQGGQWAWIAHGNLGLRRGFADSREVAEHEAQAAQKALEKPY